MKVPIVSDREFTEKVLRSKDPVLVAFRASWCMPSQDLAPIIDELAAEFDGRVKVVAVDVDRDSAATCRRYKVNRFPVTMMFADGQVADLIGGWTDKKTIAEMVSRRLGPVIEVDQHNFDAEVLRSSVPTVVHFHAAWCSASKELVPLLDEMGERFRGRAKVVRVEFGPDTAQLCARYGVVRVPTTALFVDGKLEDQILGAMVGGTKVGGRTTSCVGLTSEDNLTGMLSQFIL